MLLEANLSRVKAKWLARVLASLTLPNFRLCMAGFSAGFRRYPSANNRLTYSLKSRARTIGTLLYELSGDPPRIWIPLIAGATVLIGLFAGMRYKTAGIAFLQQRLCRKLFKPSQC